MKVTPTISDSELEFFQRTFGFLYEPEPRQRSSQRRPDIVPLAEIAAELGLSVERTRQIELRALRKIRAIAEQYGLRELLGP